MKSRLARIALVLSAAWLAFASPFEGVRASASTCCRCTGSVGLACPIGGAACSGGFNSKSLFLSAVCISVPCSEGVCTSGTECSADPDCAPVGACCLPDASCSEDTADVCSIRNGTYNGDGTNCAVGLCSPLGCCKCTGSIGSTCPLGTPACSEGFTNEVVYLNKVCLPSPCSLATCSFGADCSTTFPECGPLGACCLPDGTCSQDTASSCAVREGTYSGDGTECALGVCSPTVEAPVTSRRGLAVSLALLAGIAIMAIVRRQRGNQGVS